MNKTQQGRSMIEMLGVLAIVGVLSVGGIMAYNMAMNKFKTNKQMDQIQLIMTNIKTLFASNTNYDGLNNAVLVGLGVLQSHDQNAMSGSLDQEVQVDNAFGGSIWVKANSGDFKGTLGTAVANGSYTIAIDNIPRSACAVMANNDWGGADSGLLELSIDKNSNLTAGQDQSATVGTSVYVSGDSGTVVRKNVALLAGMCVSSNNMYWVVK